MRFLSVNCDSFLIELDSLQQTLALYNRLQQLQHPMILDLIPAARTVLVYFDALRTKVAEIQRWICGLDIDFQAQQEQRSVDIPIIYDGEDLAQVADIQGCSVAEVIRRHQQSLWQVAFIGFAPGFAYLSSPEHPFVDMPRLAVPRKKIAAGSLGLAGQYAGIYPKDSPGGWQLIGRTKEKMWDLTREQPALLLPGMSVNFYDASHAAVSVDVATTLQKVTAVKQQELTNTAKRPACLKIIAASLQMLLQDQGRFQQSHLGVGSAGAVDRAAFHSANRIVGNPENSTVIELLSGGFKAKVLLPIVFTVTGAKALISVRYANQQQVDFAGYQAIALDHGDEFYIRTPTAGLRHYLAIRGGIVAEPILGSCSYDSLALLGPQPLKVGDEIMLGQLATQAIAVNEIPVSNLPKVGDTVTLDIVMGPRTDWFDQVSIDRLCQQSWTVSQDSNRVALRLQGEQALTRCIQHELESEGTCTGALQVPPNGQPVLFMNDHPLTGGYPVIASVAKHHWDLLAQIPAGCQIKFKKIAEFTEIESR